MKRGLFFWLEKLKIAPAERWVITTLLVLLLFLGGLNMGLSPKVPFEEEKYEALDQQFAERTAMLQAQEEKLMERYYPTPGTQLVQSQKDTVTDDSSSAEQKEMEEGSGENNDQQSIQKINVNTARQEALETLPGIGPTYAKRIISYRNKNGAFQTLEELKKIKGIAQKRLDKLMPFIQLKDSN